MLFSMTWRRSETSRLEKLMLVMASCIGIVVFRDTTSRLHGYGNALFVVRSLADRFLAGTFNSIGLRALGRSHEMRWVGPLMLDRIDRILILGPALWVLMRC